ncbi:MAG: hypothetical protein MUE51_02080 [Thermoleophilia bacterium]|jgi:hypothetical protein|nr:hypothetical protein [Thermoleophilia bacterium]
MAGRTSPALLTVLVLAAAGCGGGGTTTTTTGERPRTQPVEAPRTGTAEVPAAPTWERPGIAAVLGTLRRQLGGDPRIYGVSASPRWVVVVVQDPRVRRNLDRYDWQDGAFTGPEPYGVRDPRDLAWQTVPLSALRPGVFRGLVRRAERIPLEGGVTGSVSLGVGVRGPVLSVSRSGVRERLTVRADRDGRIVEVDRSTR